MAEPEGFVLGATQRADEGAAAPSSEAGLGLEATPRADDADAAASAVALGATVRAAASGSALAARSV